MITVFVEDAPWGGAIVSRSDGGDPRDYETLREAFGWGVVLANALKEEGEDVQLLVNGDEFHPVQRMPLIEEEE